MNDQRDRTIDHIAMLVEDVRRRSDGDPWDTAGVMTHVRKAAALGQPLAATACACIRAAAEPRNRTPAVMSMPGPHWRNDDAPTRPNQPPRSSEACPDHPSQFRDHCAGCHIDAKVDDDQSDVDELGLRGYEAWAHERTRLGLTTTPTDRQETTS